MIDVIRARRSIRYGFSGREVSEERIAQIVDCGLHAPSSKNAQPWCMHIVTDEAVRRELADAVQYAKDADRFVPIDPATGVARAEWDATVAESAQVLRDAPLAIFVENRGAFSDGRRTVAAAVEEHRENALIGYSLEIIGIGAAVQNMWLAAQVHGLAGVFMGDVLIAEAAIRERLGMRGDLAGVLALGHTDGSPAPKSIAPGRVMRHGGAPPHGVSARP
jgi:nitroreductase